MIDVVWFEDTSVTDPGEMSDEPYSWRGTTYTSVYDFEARYSEGEGNPRRGMIRHGAFDCDAKPGDTVYAVIVRYSTGDTFGREDGQTTCMDVFTDQDEAEQLAQECQNATDFSMTVNGREYYVAWTGYFESLEGVEVEKLVVQ